MTVLEWLTKMAGPAAGLEGFLNRVATSNPELAGEADMLIRELNAAVNPANLAAIGAAIPGELLNIAQGKLDPRSHPGDFA